MPIYLRQKTTGHIFIATPTLMGRKDMEPYDPDVVAKRIEAQKKQLAEIEAGKKAPQVPPEAISKMAADSRILADLEKEVERQTSIVEAEAEGKPVDEGKIKTEAEIVAKNKQDRVDEDLEVRKIRAMTSKAEVQEYSLLNFGLEFKPELHMKEMKRLAVEERSKIIFAKD